MKQKGGLFQKNNKINSWKAVNNMINNPNATLTIITYLTSGGFIFKIDIPKDTPNVEFYNLNPETKQFDIPVYTLVFKIIILTTDPKINSLPYAFEINVIDQEKKQTVIRKNKNCELLENVKKEVIYQQNCYLQTLSPNGLPITLSIVDFSYFSTTNSNAILNNFLRINNNNPNDDNAENPYYDSQYYKVKTCLNYIKNIINKYEKNSSIAIISMEMANENMVNIKNVPNVETYNSAYICATAQIIILLLKCKLINYDCHSGNILANIGESRYEGNNSILIDFGEIATFNNNNLVLKNQEYEVYITELYNEMAKDDTLKEKVLSYNCEDFVNKDIETINKIKDVIKFISCMDFAIKQRVFLTLPIAQGSNRELQQEENADLDIIYNVPSNNHILNFIYTNRSENWYTEGPPNFYDNDKDTNGMIERIIDMIFNITQLQITRQPTGEDSEVGPHIVDKYIKENYFFKVKDDFISRWHPIVSLAAKRKLPKCIVQFCGGKQTKKKKRTRKLKYIKN